MYGSADSNPSLPPKVLSGNGTACMFEFVIHSRPSPKTTELFCEYSAYLKGRCSIRTGQGLERSAGPSSLAYDGVSQRLFVGGYNGFVALDATTGKVLLQGRRSRATPVLAISSPRGSIHLKLICKMLIINSLMLAQS